ncbi:MAG: winged helix-turn-helix domain-containing protein [Bacteroidota bacterium]
METRLLPDDAYWVGERLVEPLLNRLTEGGVSVSVEPRVMAVLTYLAQAPGRVVSRDELLGSVWSDVVVNEDALTRAVSEVRKLFGDDPREPAVVQTIRGRGYRLIAPVRPAGRATGDGVAGEGRAQSDGLALGDGQAGGNGASTALPIPTPSASVPRRAVPTRAVPWRGIMLAAVAVALGGLMVWVLSQRALSDSVAFAPPVPFTSYPGQEVEPAVSPEGARVAFAWNGGESESYDVYVKQPSREAPLRLTDHPASEGSPAWSPDGSEVAFIRYDDEPGIYIVPSLGGSARRVHAVDPPAYAYSLDWSPDGTMLVFSQESEDGRHHIRALDLASGEARALTQPRGEFEGDRTPRFSPDSRQVAFARSGYVGGRDVIVLTLETGEERRVAENQGGMRGLDWLDAESLVVASYRSGTYGLWRVDVASGDQTWIPATGEWSYAPSVAAQTGALVYQDVRFEKDVWQIRLDGPGGQVLGTEPLVVSTHYDCEARLSPDGKRLAFISSRSGDFQVWVSAADGQNPVAATSFDGASVGNPHWSPDGRRLAFSATPEGSASVYVVPVEGGVPERVTPEDWNALLTGWSRDGESVYFTSDRSGSWQLWRAPLDGGDPTQVTTNGALFAAEAPNGRSLYIVRPDMPGLWRLAMEDGRATGEPEFVVENLTVRGARDWVLLDTGVYYLQREEGVTSVAFHEFATGESRTVSEVVRIASPSLAASPDGATLLYGRVERSESDVYFLAPDV